MIQSRARLFPPHAHALWRRRRGLIAAAIYTCSGVLKLGHTGVIWGA